MLSPALIEDIVTFPFHAAAGSIATSKGHAPGKGLIHGFRNYNKTRNFAMSAASGVPASPSIASRVATNAFNSNLKNTASMAMKMSFSGGAAAYFGFQMPMAIMGAKSAPRGTKASVNDAVGGSSNYYRAKVNSKTLQIRCVTWYIDPLKTSLRTCEEHFRAFLETFFRETGRVNHRNRVVQTFMATDS